MANTESLSLRLVDPNNLSDVESVLDIYTPYVFDTAITFETQAPSLGEMQSRIAASAPIYPFLVCEDENGIVGYAYGSRHRAKAAYDWSVESTVYVGAGFHRRGIARRLYATLFSLLTVQRYARVFAGVTLPNESSEGLHRAFGFEHIGDFERIGFKHGRWHTVRWFQRDLMREDWSPRPLLLVDDLQSMPEFHRIMKSAQEY